MMKILAVASTMDLSQRLGCTPSWWQLWKALHEIGHEVIVTPYLGDPVEGLWWSTYPNPCRRESLLFNRYLLWQKGRGKSPGRRTPLTPMFTQFIKRSVRPKWKRHLQKILDREKTVEAVLFMNVPLNHIAGISREVVKPVGIRSVFYDGDMPSILPEHSIERGFRFNYYSGVDLSEYDMFLVNSEAVIPKLKAMGAARVMPFHYAVDPGLFSPVQLPKSADVSYYALSSVAREHWMTELITRPSLKLTTRKFMVAGGPFAIDLGNADNSGDLTYSRYRDFCCKSVINLNITSRTHASAHGTSTSRPFELAALGSCIVSQPYNGIEAWFDVDREIAIVNNEKEAIEKYENLLDNREEAQDMGLRARKRVLQEHTYVHRARALTTVMAGF